MKANGRKVKKVVVECGKAMKVKAIQGSGKMVQCKGLESIYPKTATDMKVNSRTLKNMVWEHKDSQMVKHTQATTKKIDQMEKANISGQTETITKVIFQIVSDTGKAILNKTNLDKFTKANIVMIKNADMDNLSIQMKKFMLEIFRMI